MAIQQSVSVRPRGGRIRVLIYTNGPLTQVLRTADASRISSPAKYYVAFTRARQSVAFVMAGACAWPGHQIYESPD